MSVFNPIAPSAATIINLLRGLSSAEMFLGISPRLFAAVHEKSEIRSISTESEILRNNRILFVVFKLPVFLCTVYGNSLSVVYAVITENNLTDIAYYYKNQTKQDRQDDF